MSKCFLNSLNSVAIKTIQGQVMMKLIQTENDFTIITIAFYNCHTQRWRCGINPDEMQRSRSTLFTEIGVMNKYIMYIC